MSNVNPAKLMDGRAAAQRMRDAARGKVEKIRAAAGVTPTLATVLVGARPASRRKVLASACANRC